MSLDRADRAHAHVQFEFPALSARDRFLPLVATVIPGLIEFGTSIDERIGGLFALDETQ